jgi:RNA polymerase sigma factor (sigma-70 family)
MERTTRLAADFDVVLAAALGGEAWAWKALYDGLAPRIYGYLRARAEPDCEDLVAEVLMQVVRDLDRFQGGEDEFRAWVMTIAHHRLLDERRRRARRPVTVTDGIPEKAGGDVHEEALERIHEEQVRRAIAGLSEQQQAVLLMRIIGDLTVEQVAKALGKRPGAVKALQRRGLEVLKREFEPERVTV